jgi:hypothetical protein
MGLERKASECEKQPPRSGLVQQVIRWTETAPINTENPILVGRNDTPTTPNRLIRDFRHYIKKGRKKAPDFA